jgi:hypothetical protein
LILEKAWRAFIVLVQRMNETELWEAIKEEQRGARRKSYLERMHKRASHLRMKREREELVT